MERLLISADELRKIQKKIIRISEDETRNAANKLFPFFMQSINEQLVNQTGCGVILNLHSEVSKIDGSEVLSHGSYKYSVFYEEMVRLLKEQLESITDFSHRFSGNFVVVNVNDQDQAQ